MNFRKDNVTHLIELSIWTFKVDVHYNAKGQISKVNWFKAYVGEGYKGDIPYWQDELQQATDDLALMLKPLIFKNEHKLVRGS